MQEITYRQAAELLECEYITIRQAVSSGRLTKCANKTTLLKEQVELFKGKRGITVHVLNLEEKQLWESYKEVAANPNLLDKVNFISMTSSDVLEAIMENKFKGTGKADNEGEYILVIKASREALEALLKGINNHPTSPLVHQN